MHGTLAMTAETNPNVYQGLCDWIALLSQPNAEQKACRWLEIRQFKPYWPCYNGQVKLNRHRRAVKLRGAIPGYVFVPITREQDKNWELLKRTPGIHGFMTNGEGGPKFLTPMEIGEVQRIEAALNSSEINAKEGIPFKVGQKVRPADDLFLQWEGKIVRIDSRRQIAVEVPGLFGSTPVVMFSADKLEAV